MDRNSIKILKQLVAVIIDEMEHNDEFAYKVEQILSKEKKIVEKKNKRTSETKRASNRRDPAVLDPGSLILQDEQLLIEELQKLTVSQLKDIIADYGMDPFKLAMRWRKQERLINHIVDTARRRATKGDAFREHTDKNVDKDTTNDINNK